LHQFCAVDLGAFYLDVLKDRMYTTRTDSRARRSAQTAMMHVLEALVRWMAPILSFTAEEIWRYLPGSRSASVLLETWYPIPDGSGDPAASDDFWERILAIRTEISRELEKLRIAGGIGSSLEAEVDLYVDGENRQRLAPLGDELRFVLITSAARLHDLRAGQEDGVASTISGLRIQVNPSAHAKCERCWHRRPDVGTSSAHPGLCGRCIENIDGSGEERSFA